MTSGINLLPRKMRSGGAFPFLNASLTPVSQSEEHFVCENEPGAKYKTGDVLYGLPYHICPTVALYERAYTIENKKVSGEWKIIRPRQKDNGLKESKFRSKNSKK